MTQHEYAELYNEEPWLDDIEIPEPSPIKCCSCCKEIPCDDGKLDRCARIERGDFTYQGEEVYSENIKYERFVCQACFMN
jgi:hypothetical protein